MSYPPPRPNWQQPVVKPPAKRRASWKLISGITGGILALCCGGLYAIGALTGAGDDRPAGTVASQPVAPVESARPAADPVVDKATPKPKPTTRKADPDKDLGAGKPGAFCATNRLGKSFVKEGVRYTCKGPKPYRWRCG